MTKRRVSQDVARLNPAVEFAGGRVTLNRGALREVAGRGGGGRPTGDRRRRNPNERPHEAGLDLVEHLTRLHQGGLPLLLEGVFELVYGGRPAEGARHRPVHAECRGCSSQ